MGADILKILILNWRDINHPQAGGAERYVHEIGRRLALKHEVTFLCGGYPGASSEETIDQMSHRIVGMRELGPDVFWARIEAPLIAQARRPGQFIILSINNDYSERIPLTIAGANPADGTIELIWQRVGKTTAELAGLNEGDEIANISGPLGTPTYIANFGTVVCVGGGIGAAPLLPIATALKTAGGIANHRGDGSAVQHR